MEPRPDLPEMLRRAGIATAEQAEALRAEMDAADVEMMRPFVKQSAELRARQDEMARERG